MDKVISLRLNALDLVALKDCHDIIFDQTNIQASDSVIIKTALDLYAKTLRSDPAFSKL